MTFHDDYLDDNREHHDDNVDTHDDYVCDNDESDNHVDANGDDAEVADHAGNADHDDLGGGDHGPWLY